MSPDPITELQQLHEDAKASHIKFQLHEDPKASHIELQWLRKRTRPLAVRASRTAETKDLRKIFKASQIEATKVPSLESGMRELEQESRIMRSFAKMGPQVYDEATKLRKELDSTRKLNKWLREENVPLRRAKRSITPEAKQRPSVVSTRVGPGTKTENNAMKAEQLKRLRTGGRRAIRIHIDPVELRGRRAPMEEKGR